MYEVGKVYIWQNMPGKHSYLNGTETTVVEPLKEVLASIAGTRAQWVWQQRTDTKCIDSHRYMGAMAGDLRPKNPPTGERLVRDLFEPKPVMEPA